MWSCTPLYHPQPLDGPQPECGSAHMSAHHEVWMCRINMRVVGKCDAMISVIQYALLKWYKIPTVLSPSWPYNGECTHTVQTKFWQEMYTEGIYYWSNVSSPGEKCSKTHYTWPLFNISCPLRLAGHNFLQQCSYHLSQKSSRSREPAVFPCIQVIVSNSAGTLVSTVVDVMSHCVVTHVMKGIILVHSSDYLKYFRVNCVSRL